MKRKLDLLEKNTRRNRTAIAAALLMVFFIASSATYFYQYSNAQKINDKLCPTDPVLCDMLDKNNLYNVGFLMWDDWTDAVTAAKYKSDIADYTDDRYAMGSRFTLIYLNGGVVSLMLAISYCLMLMSKWFCSRVLAMIGFSSASLFWTFHVFTMVMTGVFRYSSMGKLAALSTCPTSYDDDATYDDYYVSDKRTYADDAKLVTALWVCQFVVLVAHVVYTILIFCWNRHEVEKTEQVTASEDKQFNHHNLINDFGTASECD